VGFSSIKSAQETGLLPSIAQWGQFGEFLANNRKIRRRMGAMVLTRKPNEEADMNHPITLEIVARIRQAELLEEAANRRAIKSAQVNRPGLSRRWLPVALAISALAVGLAVIFVAL
jgi:hypothetical protein